MRIHEHDCTKCQYLGSFNNKDLYHCNDGVGEGTVIARNSSEGSDYSSGLIFGVIYRDDKESPIGEAYRRALKLELVTSQYRCNDCNNTSKNIDCLQCKEFKSIRIEALESYIDLYDQNCSIGKLQRTVKLLYKLEN